MARAGDYRQRFTVWTATRTTSVTTGDRPKTYTNSGVVLWGAEETSQANIETDFGAVRSQVSGTIRLRNFPTLTTLDRLIGGYWNTTYIIDGIRKDERNNETVVDCHSLEIL